jgi:hypothetical protein
MMNRLKTPFSMPIVVWIPFRFLSIHGRSGVSAAGTDLTPLIDVPRKTIELKHRIQGHARDKVTCTYQENGFTTLERFELCRSDILIPFVAKRREEESYRGFGNYRAFVLASARSANRSILDLSMGT